MPDALNACAAPFYTLFPDICDYYQVDSNPVYLDLKIRPQLPPVIKVNTSKSGTLTTSVQIGDMFMYLTTDVDGSPETVLNLAVSTKIPTIISHNGSDGTLDVSFGTPTVFVDTVDNPLALPENLFEGIGPILVEFLLPIINDAISGFSFPNFVISGDEYMIALNTLAYLGSTMDFIGLFGDIWFVPPKEW